MRKITKLLKGLVLITFLLIMTNCAFEDGSHIISNSSSEAATWFEKHKNEYNTTIIKYVDDLQWDKAIVNDGGYGKVVEVPFTLKNKLSNSNKEGTLFNDQHRLMFVKGENREYNVFYVQIFSDNKDYKIVEQHFNIYDIPIDFDGKIFVQNLATGAIQKIEFKSKSEREKSLTAKVFSDSDQQITCVYYGYWYEDGHFEPLELIGCSGGGSDNPADPTYGGGGEGGGSVVIVPANDAAPSCESFNFTSKPGANWQESVVQNIRFQVILVDEDGVTFLHTVSFPQGISFGMPKTFTNGTKIRPGVAATTSAHVLDQVIAMMYAKYAKSNVSDTTIRLDFRQTLINEYREGANGGLVNFNYTGTIPATQYKTNWFLPGNCDEAY